LKPSGVDSAVQDYTLPATNACFFNAAFDGSSFDVADEATFKQMFHCSSASDSTLDFSQVRVHVSVFASGARVAREWAVEAADAIHLGFTPVPSCGGAAPPLQSSMVLLPAGSKPVLEDLCTSGCNFGSGGFPP
jgi:hypothetical protein